MFFWEFSHRRNTYKWIKKLEYFHGQHTLFAMSDKRKYIKNPYKEEKLGINQQKRSQTSGRGSLLNLTKVWEMDQ